MIGVTLRATLVWQYLLLKVGICISVAAVELMSAVLASANEVEIVAISPSQFFDVHHAASCCATGPIVTPRIADA
jgi:hypothetical protein